MQELLTFWSELDLDKKTLIHPLDQKALDAANTYYSYKNSSDYFENVYCKSKSLFNVDLVPVPYAGDLSSATVFILQLNPGLTFLDHYAEQKSIEFVNQLIPK